MLDINEFWKVDKIFEYEGHAILPVLNNLSYALDNRCQDIKGIVAEFGVFKGISLNHMARHDPTVTFYGFDSFIGLPEDWPFNEGLTMRRDKFDLDGMPPEVEKNVTIVSGWFNESISRWKEDCPSDISLLHIDCDLYSSALCVLNELNDRIVKGTVIVFDELCDFRLLANPRVRMHNEIVTKVYTKWRHGEWKALNEWVNKFDRQVKPISRAYGMQSSMIVTV